MVSAARSPRLRPILVVLGVWIVVTGIAIAWAAALDEPVGAGSRDEAQPAAVGQIADPGATGSGDVSAPEGLPPLALVVDTPLPADLAGLDASDAAVRLRDRVLAGGTAEEWVLLGSLLQQLDRGPMAAGSYRAALELRPDDLAAQVGLALVDGATGPEGAARAAAPRRPGRPAPRGRRAPPPPAARGARPRGGGARRRGAAAPRGRAPAEPGGRVQPGLAGRLPAPGGARAGRMAADRRTRSRLRPRPERHHALERSRKRSHPPKPIEERA